MLCLLPGLAYPLPVGSLPRKYTLQLELPKDNGRPAGTLFELRSSQGKLLVGAGFSLANNTTQASNPRILSVHLETSDQAVRVTNLGKPFPDHLPSQLLNLGGKLLALPYNQFRIGPKVYVPKTKRWEDVPIPFGQRRADLMSIQAINGQPLLLRYYRSRIYYQNQEIRTPKSWSKLVANDCFYLNGHLYVFLQDPDQKYVGSVAICRWQPGDRDLIEINRFPLQDYGFFYTFIPHPSGAALIAADRLGRVYRITPTRVLLEHQTLYPEASYQLYSSVRWGSNILFGHYPTGNLVDYSASLDDGFLVPRIGHQPGSSDTLREAQSIAVFGDRLVVGVWPWGELWQGTPGGEWSLLARPFKHIVNGDLPYTERITPTMKSPANALGQRIWGMANWGTGLAFSTSHYNLEHSAVLNLLTTQEREAYGSVYLLEQGYELACEITGSGRMELTVEITTSRLAVYQDRRLIASRVIDATTMPAVDGELVLGHGIWGDFAGTISRAPATVR